VGGGGSRRPSSLAGPRSSGGRALVLELENRRRGRERPRRQQSWTRRRRFLVETRDRWSGRLAAITRRRVVAASTTTAQAVDLDRGRGMCPPRSDSAPPCQSPENSSLDVPRFRCPLELENCRAREGAGHAGSCLDHSPGPDEPPILPRPYCNVTGKPEKAYISSSGHPGRPIVGGGGSRRPSSPAGPRSSGGRALVLELENCRRGRERPGRQQSWTRRHWFLVETRDRWSGGLAAIRR